MNEEPESQVKIFIKKFEKILNLLLSLRLKSKDSFTEDVSFLLEKALDHLKQIDVANSEDHGHSVSIRNQIFKQFFADTLNVTKTSPIHPPIIIFSIKLLNELSNTESRFKKSITASPETFAQIQQIITTPLIENAEVKHELLQFFSSLSKFHSGCEWIWLSGFLQFITTCLEDRAVFIRKTAQELTTEILMSLTGNRKKEVYERLLIPIRTYEAQLNNGLQNRSDGLQLYFSVLENHIEKNFLEKDNRSGSELAELDVEDLLIGVAKKTTSHKCVQMIYSLLVCIYAKCASEESGNEVKIKEWEVKTVGIIQQVLDAQSVATALNVTSKSLFFWSHLSGCKEFQLDLVHIMVSSTSFWGY